VRMTTIPDRSLSRAIVIALMLVFAALAGCGGRDGDETAFVPLAGTESAYCDTYRAWQVHELEGDGDDQPNPAAFEKYWNEHLEYNATSLRQAPAVIRDEWAVSERAIRTVLTPLLTKYDFDVKRMEREATPAEKALSVPPPEVQKAQATIHAYEAKVCGTDSPPAARVAFTPDASSKRYCTVLATFNSGLERVASSRFDSDVMRAFVAGDRLRASLDALETSAPDAIAADQAAASDWFRTRWSDVVAEFDYDIRRIWLDGTAEDRAVFHFAHPDVAEHESRLAAYEEQVCAA
jgi:hypothetical protein